MPTIDSQVARRILIALAGVFGAIGVASAARASHGLDSRNLGAIATVFLAHAPALLALGLAGRGKALIIAAGVLAAGTALFGLDLGIREWLSHGAFPGAAPLGGVLMVLGWIGVGLTAMVFRNLP